MVDVGCSKGFERLGLFLKVSRKAAALKLNQHSWPRLPGIAGIGIGVSLSFSGSHFSANWRLQSQEHKS